MKSVSGWSPMRIVVTAEGTIVAGIQVLLRRLAFWSLGYAGGGPVFASDDPSIRAVLLDELIRQSRKRRILYLGFQPAQEDSALLLLLGTRGFTPSSAELISRATILIDLSKPEADLLSQLRKRHRSYVRQADRAGVTVREVGEEDLPTVYSLMKSRAERRGFAADSMETLRAMWRVLAPSGHMRVTLAEYAGEAIATLVMVCWGETVYWKRGGWNRKYGNLGVNELQHWESLLWAKGQGFRWADLEGIDYESAREILFGEKASYDIRKSPNFFKLGYGGQLRVNPTAQEWFSSPLIRFAARRVYPRLKGTKALAKILRWLRGVR